jgi:DNA-binding LytR/AlgR family response regulator
MKALIVDDEAPMRDQLRARLKDVWPELDIVGEAANGFDAVTMVDQLKPELVFLDIRMPGQSGIETARQLCNSCHIVFVTAYDQYAIDAFEHGAVDYLLKPVVADRLQLTRERLLARVDKGSAPANISAQLAQLTEILQQGESKKHEYLRWIQAQVGTSLRMINTKEVLFFQAEDKYTRVQTMQGEVLIRKTLKELSDELDPREFWRIHRSTLVRVDAIAGVSRDLRGRQMLKLHNHEELLEVSRNHSHLFQQM